MRRRKIWATTSAETCSFSVTMRNKIIIAVLSSIFCLTGCGRQSAPDSSKISTPVKSSVGINRKTFSMSLPAGWFEDTKDDMYDAESFMFFENPESCLFCVIIGKKSAGFSVDEMLEKHKEQYSAKMTDLSTSSFDGWSNYRGKGMNITGKVQGAFQYRCHLFGFENGDSACVIIEAANPADFNKFAGDFELIRQSFKLK